MVYFTCEESKLSHANLKIVHEPKAYAGILNQASIKLMVF